MWRRVDDGHATTVQADLCEPEVWAGVPEGDVVKVALYRRCRKIRRLTTTTPSRFRSVSA